MTAPGEQPVAPLKMEKVRERLSGAAEAARPNHWGNRIHYFDADDVEALLAENAKLREEYAELATLNLGLSVENAKLREALEAVSEAIEDQAAPRRGRSTHEIAAQAIIKTALNEDKP